MTTLMKIPSRSTGTKTMDELKRQLNTPHPEHSPHLTSARRLAAHYFNTNLIPIGRSLAMALFENDLACGRSGYDVEFPSCLRDLPAMVLALLLMNVDLEVADFYEDAP